LLSQKASWIVLTQATTKDTILILFDEFVRNPDRIISEPEVIHLVGLSKSHIMRLEDRGEFPKRIKLALRRVGWSLQEVRQWVEDKKQNRHSHNINEEA
jgi:prophage regulatory protein